MLILNLKKHSGYLQLIYPTCLYITVQGFDMFQLYRPQLSTGYSWMPEASTVFLPTGGSVKSLMFGC